MKQNTLMLSFLAAITLLLMGIFIQNQQLLARLTAQNVSQNVKLQETRLNQNVSRYGIVPLNEDGSIDVRIKSAERLGVSIEDINTYDNLEVTLDDINTTDELEVDIQEVGNSTVSSSGIPVRVRN